MCPRELIGHQNLGQMMFGFLAPFLPGFLHHSSVFVHNFLTVQARGCSLYSPVSPLPFCHVNCVTRVKHCESWKLMPYNPPPQNVDFLPEKHLLLIHSYVHFFFIKSFVQILKTMVNVFQPLLEKECKITI